jgi:uncharacterized membrane protein YccC
MTLAARLEKALRGDWAGVHFAANVFVATAVLWLLLRKVADLNPIWAISSMIAASDPQVREAVKTTRGRLINAILGCAVGLAFLMLGHAEVTLPFALAVAVLLSTYVVRVQVMWRQAPITAAIVIAASWSQHSEFDAMRMGVRRVGEVLLGCVVGVAVSWMMSKVWPLPEKPKKDEQPHA